MQKVKKYKKSNKKINYKKRIYIIVLPAFLLFTGIIFILLGSALKFGTFDWLNNVWTQINTGFNNILVFFGSSTTPNGIDTFFEDNRILVGTSMFQFGLFIFMFGFMILIIGIFEIRDIRHILILGILIIMMFSIIGGVILSV